MGDQSRELRIVTALTIGRFPLVLLFFFGALCNVHSPSATLFVASFTALVLSAVTDLFDGRLARRYGVETQFGAHADPLMDKFFYLATLPLLVYVAQANGHIRHAIALLLMTLMFLTRDQWVTFLRSIGSIYQVSGQAHWAGKVRTALNFPLIAGIYVFEECPVQIFPPMLVYVFEGIAIFVNALSLHTYTRSYWPYLKQAARIEPKRKASS